MESFDRPRQLFEEYQTLRNELVRSLYACMSRLARALLRATPGITGIEIRLYDDQSLQIVTDASSPELNQQVAWVLYHWTPLLAYLEGVETDVIYELFLQHGNRNSGHDDQVMFWYQTGPKLPGCDTCLVQHLYALAQPGKLPAISIEEVLWLLDQQGYDAAVSYVAATRALVVLDSAMSRSA